ncbi:hypothetical protein B4144_0542 [Bacillus atrophaeus]|nr:hypothetical protein B4144_0542 [Bacillus atrophaeus]
MIGIFLLLSFKKLRHVVKYLSFTFFRIFPAQLKKYTYEASE